MKHSGLTLALFLLLTTIATAQEITLKYKWKPNALYKFKSVQKDEVKMEGSPGAGMPGMPDMGGMGGMMAISGNTVYNTNSAFTLKINSVNPDGSAAGMFYIESFRVTDGSGKAMAGLAGIPRAALKAPFIVDEQGNFTFTELPVLIVGENRTVLTVVQVDGSECASGEDAGDGESVKVYAEFTKTGGLKAGYTVTSISKPKAKAIAIGEEDEVIDLIPTDFLDFLAVPDGPVQEGQAQEMKGGGQETIFKIASLKGNNAVLTTHIGAKVNAQEMKDAGDKAMGDEATAEDADADAIPRIVQESIGDITVNFDRAAGMFKSLSGKVSNSQDMMGMQIFHKGSFSMTPVQ